MNSIKDMPVEERGSSLVPGQGPVVQGDIWLGKVQVIVVNWSDECIIG